MKPVVAAVAVLAFVAGLIVVIARSGDSPSDLGQQGWVAVDGWSWQMRDGKPLEVLVDGDEVDAEFRPASVDDIKEMLAADPDSVRNLMARIVTSDPTLTCDEKKCETSSGAVPLEQLVTPDNAAITAAGAKAGVYVARPQVADSATKLAVRLKGSKSMAERSLVALAPVSTSSTTVPTASLPSTAPPTPDAPTAPNATVVPTPDGTGVILPVPAPSQDAPDDLTDEEIKKLEEKAKELGLDLDAPAPEVPDTPPTTAVDPNAPSTTLPVDGPVNTTPFDENDATTTTTVDTDGGTGIPAVLAAGVSWGQVFPLEHTWFAPKEGPPSIGAFGAVRSDVSPVTDEVPASDAPFMKGLATSEESASTLTPSQLTIWSDPTIGCGIGVVCAPTADGVAATDVAPSWVGTACVTPRTGIPAADGLPKLRIPVTVTLRDRSLDFAAGSRMQLGNWSDDTAVPESSFWPVPIQPSSDSFTLRTRTAEVRDANGLLTVVGSQAPSLDGEWNLDTLFASSASLLLGPCE